MPPVGPAPLWHTAGLIAALAVLGLLGAWIGPILCRKYATRSGHEAPPGTPLSATPRTAASVAAARLDKYKYDGDLSRFLSIMLPGSTRPGDDDGESATRKTGNDAAPPPSPMAPLTPDSDLDIDELHEQLIEVRGHVNAAEKRATRHAQRSHELATELDSTNAALLESITAGYGPNATLWASMFEQTLQTGSATTTPSEDVACLTATLCQAAMAMQQEARDTMQARGQRAEYQVHQMKSELQMKQLELSDALAAYTTMENAVSSAISTIGHPCVQGESAPMPTAPSKPPRPSAAPLVPTDEATTTSTCQLSAVSPDSTLRRRKSASRGEGGLGAGGGAHGVADTLAAAAADAIGGAYGADSGCVDDGARRHGSKGTKGGGCAPTTAGAPAAKHGSSDVASTYYRRRLMRTGIVTNQPPPRFWQATAHDGSPQAAAAGGAARAPAPVAPDGPPSLPAAATTAARITEADVFTLFSGKLTVSLYPYNDLLIRARAPHGQSLTASGVNGAPTFLQINGKPSLTELLGHACGQRSVDMRLWVYGGSSWWTYLHIGDELKPNQPDRLALATADVYGEEPTEAVRDVRLLRPRALTATAAAVAVSRFVAPPPPTAPQLPVAAGFVAPNSSGVNTTAVARIQPALAKEYYREEELEA